MSVPSGTCNVPSSIRRNVSSMRASVDLACLGSFVCSERACFSPRNMNTTRKPCGRFSRDAMFNPTFRDNRRRINASDGFFPRFFPLRRSEQQKRTRGVFRKSLSHFDYRRWDLNPHPLAGTGF